MNNKFQGLRDLANSTKTSILAIPETWGKNPTTDYSIKGFHRPEFTLRTGSGMNLGGGLGLWVRSDIDFEVIKVKSIDRVCEMQAITIPDKNLSILNVYRPFGDVYVFLDTLTMNIETMTKAHPHNDIVMVGDFNIDLDKSSCNTDELIDTTLTLGFLQQVTLPTRVTDKYSSLIDHVYTRSKKTLVTDVVLSTISYHYATLTSFVSTKMERKKIKITKRWFTQESYEQIATYLGGMDWAEMDAMNCDNAAIHLNKVITEAMDIIV